MEKDKKMEKDKVLKSFKEIDLTKFTAPIIVVYNRPKDYPKNVVARIFEIDKPTKFIVSHSCFTKMKMDLRKNTGLTCIGRGEKDEPTVLEVWI